MYRALLNSRSIEQVRRSLSTRPMTPTSKVTSSSFLVFYCRYASKTHNILIIPKKPIKTAHSEEYYDDFELMIHTLRKKFMQQNLFCCPNKIFYLSNQNLIDIVKYFVGTTKEFCCINIKENIFVDVTKMFSQCIDRFFSRPYFIIRYSTTLAKSWQNIAKLCPIIWCDC